MFLREKLAQPQWLAVCRAALPHCAAVPTRAADAGLGLIVRERAAFSYVCPPHLKGERGTAESSLPGTNAAACLELLNLRGVTLQNSTGKGGAAHPSPLVTSPPVLLF